MKDSKPLLDLIHDQFEIADTDTNRCSSLTLAYLGDSVYEIIIRTLVVESSGLPVKKLHRRTCELVKAGTQAAIILSLEDDMTEEETAVFKRGRNAKTSTVAKNADIHDYRNATGLEALMGYLYLTNQMGRAIELVKTGFEHLGMEI